jgi:hypothetical protein
MIVLQNYEFKKENYEEQLYGQFSLNTSLANYYKANLQFKLGYELFYLKSKSTLKFRVYSGLCGKLKVDKDLTLSGNHKAFAEFECDLRYDTLNIKCDVNFYVQADIGLAELAISDDSNYKNFTDLSIVWTDQKPSEFKFQYSKGIAMENNFSEILKKINKFVSDDNMKIVSNTSNILDDEIFEIIKDVIHNLNDYFPINARAELKVMRVETLKIERREAIAMMHEPLKYERIQPIRYEIEKPNKTKTLFEKFAEVLEGIIEIPNLLGKRKL